MKNLEKHINEITNILNLHCKICPAHNYCNTISTNCTETFANWINQEAEEKPTKKWRPFKDTHELVTEFCKRFGVEKTSWGLPFIWVKQKSYDDGVELITGLYGTSVEVSTLLIRLDGFFKGYTFLDGSPCGVLEEVKND